jgi:predicted dehydrogenase
VLRAAHEDRGSSREPDTGELSSVPPAVPAGLSFNVAQLYMRMAEGIREKPVSPDFDVAVKRHQLLDAIQNASDTGMRENFTLGFRTVPPSDSDAR